VKDVTSTNFGLLIAYVLPGVTALWGVSYFSPNVRAWFGSTPCVSPTVGGFLYVTLAAVAAGVTVSTVRWMVVDTTHHLTGIPRPRWDFRRFDEKVAAYEMLGEVHYRYYQYHANTLISLVFTYLARRISLGFFSLPLGWIDVGLLMLSVIFAAGSRDTYRKYTDRLTMVLGNTRDYSTPEADSGQPSDAGSAKDASGDAQSGNM